MFHSDHNAHTEKSFRYKLNCELNTGAVLSRVFFGNVGVEKCIEETDPNQSRLRVLKTSDHLPPTAAAVSQDNLSQIFRSLWRNEK